MSSLNFQEKLILILYRKFFNKPYNCKNNETNEQGIVQKHIDAQKVGFYFATMGIPVGDYNFSWDVAGPYSCALQELLKEIDGSPDLVSELYAGNIDKTLLQLLESRKQVSQINEACSAMQKVVKGEKRGAELMASLLYISKTVMPYFDFESVNTELVRRKSYFSETKYKDMSGKIWDVLSESKLIPVLS